MIQKKKLEDFKCSFVNLAIPLFSMMEPMPPKKVRYFPIRASLRFEKTEFFDKSLKTMDILPDFLNRSEALIPIVSL